MKKVSALAICVLMFVIGWLVNDLTRIQKANAKSLAYKVVVYDRADQLENTLNVYAGQGWKFHSIQPGAGKLGLIVLEQ